MKDVAGKTAFITGGASGMGLGMARVWAAAGMNVVIADIRQEALDAARAGFPAGQKVHALRLDVTDRARWVAAAEEAERAFGKVHVLSLNAGVGVVGPMQTATYKDWDFCLGVNVGGVVNGLVTMLPRMLAHGESGHVVATSSTGGFSAVGGAGLYCTSKFAVAGMMESLATDLKGTPIGVSVFFPGPVQTSLGQTTDPTRPSHLKNEPGEAPPLVGRGCGPRPELRSEHLHVARGGRPARAAGDPPQRPVRDDAPGVPRRHRRAQRGAAARDPGRADQPAAPRGHQDVRHPVLQPGVRRPAGRAGRRPQVKDLAGKVAFITGGGSGVALGQAKVFAGEAA
ncbi:MAG: SDR family NAD(P)-dependent oxidoreductase [Steroidobacteraceae bacterium]